MPKSLNCPNCAAPLQVRERQTVALCVYCGSSLKLESEGGMPQPSEQRELTAEVLQQINQLLLDGRRTAAITLYVQEAGVTQTAASEAIDNLATQLTRRTMLRQPISNLGIAIVLGLSGLGLAAFWWGATNANLLIALVGAGWAALQWLAFLPGLVTRWQYETGQAAPAVVRKLIPLGEMKVRGERVSAMRLWLEVRPAGGPVYQAERNVILRQSSLAQLATGSIIEVRGRPDRREAIPVAPLKIVEAKP